jgi:hypothetical protein
MTIDELIGKVAGLSTTAALAAIKEAGFQGRVVSEDGRSKITDCQWVPGRVNLTAVSGKVVEASIG